jgi:hypothetical protein
MPESTVSRTLGMSRLADGIHQLQFRRRGGCEVPRLHRRDAATCRAHGTSISARYSHDLSTHSESNCTPSLSELDAAHQATERLRAGCQTSVADHLNRTPPQHELGHSEGNRAQPMLRRTTVISPGNAGASKRPGLPSAKPRPTYQYSLNPESVPAYRHGCWAHQGDASKVKSAHGAHKAPRHAKLSRRRLLTARCGQKQKSGAASGKAKDLGELM